MSLIKQMHLARNLFNRDKVKKIPTRNGYGEGIVEAGRKDENVVVLCADLTESTRSLDFATEFPERFVEMGVAEQNLASVAAGMAAAGKIPFISSYAAFSPGRNWEQIRTTVAYNNQPVKIAGAHAGISVGPDGATHQATEDIVTMRAIANMQVSVPCDAIQTRKVTIDMAKRKTPDYLRFARNATPVITTNRTPYKFGRADVYYQGKEVAVIACGHLVYDALEAAHELKGKVSVRVINVHTIKPLDEKTIIKAARDCGAIVTVEEGQVMGGLGGAVAETLAKHHPTPMEFIGVQDVFGETGPPDELMVKYGLTSKDVKEAILKVLKRKAKS